MEGTEPDEFATTFAQHHVLADDINDVGPLLDGLNGAGVKPGRGHGGTERGVGA